MKYFLHIILIFSMASCINSEAVDGLDMPDKLIPRNDMVTIIKEMSKLEAHIQSKYVSVVKFNKIMVSSGDSLIEANGFSRKEFDESMEYYASRQEVMKGIYNDALDQLNHELGEIQEQN